MITKEKIISNEIIQNFANISYNVHMDGNKEKYTNNRYKVKVTILYETLAKF